ncbi:MAG TPA: HEPN domain-containing protein [Candidatus Babeliales bacterium]|nr:HEPN domain-containing protein [Candidatus Babeliales bacterium]
MPGVNDWIIKATNDLHAAKKLIKDDDITLDMTAYATQQSAEKALKAYLIFKQQVVPRTHDLEKLLVECIKHDYIFDQLRSETKFLSPYATYTRYPDDRFNIDRQEAIEAIHCAEKILKFVKNNLEKTHTSPQLNILK